MSLRHSALRPLLAVILLLAPGALVASPEDAAAVATATPVEPVAAAPDPQISLTAYEAILSLDWSDEDRAKPAEGRRKAVEQKWLALDPDVQALVGRQVRWAQEHLAEGGAEPWTTARGMAFFLAGSPPSRIHSEPSRVWTGSTVPRLDGRKAVVAQLARGRRAVAELEAKAAGRPLPAPDKAAPATDTLTLNGGLPTEVWVYSTAVPSQLRVLTFVDDQGTGAYRLVKDELADATLPTSTAQGVELPADLFPQASAGREFKPLPVLTTDVLRPTVVTAVFKALAAKTHVRFFVAISPEDVDLELDMAAADYLAKARILVRIEQAGEAVDELEAVPATPPLTPIDGALVADLGTPLLPGEYEYTVLVTDEAGKGGRVKGRLSVPSLSNTLSLSTALIARAEGAGDAASLPRAVESSSGALAPFQLGTYVVKPQITRTFRRGETIAVVVQAYSAASAVIEFDLKYEGVYQASLPPVTVAQLPHTEIQLIPALDVWPDGAYSMVVTAVDPAHPDVKVVQDVPFRIKG